MATGNMTVSQMKAIQLETLKTFSNKEWFRGVQVFNVHPETGEATIEFRVNYVPLFERKEIKDFVLKFNLTERFQIIDKDGKPAA